MVFGVFCLTMTLEKTTNIVLRSLRPNRPYHVQWLVTRKCNFRCIGCNVWQEQDARELSTEEIKKGLDILRELGVLEVVFSGGNPLLREDIGEIIEYASRFFVTTVYDNGSMAVKKIADLHNADFVAISIDSLDPEKNDYIRGVKGAWHTATEAVKRLHEEGISVSVAPTISQFNLHEILDLTNYFTERNIPVWYSLYSYDLDDKSQIFKIGKRRSEFAVVDQQAMVDLFDSLIKLKKKNNNVLMTTKLLKAVRNLWLTGNRTWECRALKNFFVIDHLGRVAGCHLKEPTTTIFDLPKVWNTAKLDTLRKTYNKCSDCTYMCYMFYSVHGSVLGNFQIAHDQWRNAKLILKKENLKLSKKRARTVGNT